LRGAPTAIDWLPPTTPAPNTAAAAPGSKGGSSRMLARSEPRQQLSFVTASNLLVQQFDADRDFWVAEAHSNAGLGLVSGGDSRVRDMGVWARANMGLWEACRSRAQRVTGG
jgi:hypothetical protein